MSMRPEAMTRGEEGRKISLGGKAIPEIWGREEGERMTIKRIGREGVREYCRYDSRAETRKREKRAENALMTKCVFARACKDKTKTQLIHPHGRLFISQSTAQFLSYYKSKMALP